MKQRKKQCPICGKAYVLGSFYVSHSPKHRDGRLPICKRCCIKQSIDDDGEVDIEGLRYVLKLCDKPFLQNVFDSATETSGEKFGYKSGDEKSKNIIGIYFKNILSLKQYAMLGWADSVIKKEIRLVGKRDYFTRLKDNPLEYNFLKSLYELLSELYPETANSKPKLLADYCECRMMAEMNLSDNDLDTWKENDDDAFQTLLDIIKAEGNDDFADELEESMQDENSTNYYEDDEI